MTKALILAGVLLVSAAAYAQKATSAPSPSDLNLEWGGRTGAQQPLDALAMAKKAGQFKSLVAQGHFRIEGGGQNAMPEEMRKTDFSVAIQMPAARLAIVGKLPEFRATDGVEAVGFRPIGPAGPNGIRRKLGGDNLYAALGQGAILYDALGEYQNLMSAVTFKACPAPADVADAPAGVKWFELVPTGERPHYVVKDTKTVWLALDAQNGLPRMIVGIRKAPAAPASGPAPAVAAPPAGEPTRMIVTFDQIQTDVPIKPEDLLLPAEAAGGIWQDQATKQTTSAPASFLPAKP